MKDREIKFRGKISYNGYHRFSGEWVYGYYWKDERDRKDYIKESEDIDGLGTFEHTDFEVDPETVGQYTGLKDKNGKEIYEGDIITYDTAGGLTAKVVWKNGGFVFVYDDGVENITSECWYAPMDVEITEIIGNIH